MDQILAGDKRGGLCGSQKYIIKGALLLSDLPHVDRHGGHIYAYFMLCVFACTCCETFLAHCY